MGKSFERLKIYLFFQDGDDDNLMEALGNVDLTKDEYNSLIEHLVSWR